MDAPSNGIMSMVLLNSNTFLSHKNEPLSLLGLLIPQKENKFHAVIMQVDIFLNVRYQHYVLKLMWSKQSESLGITSFNHFI